MLLLLLLLLRVAHYFRCRCWIFWLRGKRLAYGAAAASTPVTAREGVEMPSSSYVPQIASLGRPKVF